MRYIYKSDDLSLITSDKAVFYPINAFLEKHLEKSDEVKVILLVKRDLQNASSQNVSDFIDEISRVITRASIPKSNIPIRRIVTTW